LTLLAVDGLEVEYRGRRGAPAVKAVDSVSLAIEPGETLGIVGESGCGKSSLARALIGLAPMTRGAFRLGDVIVRAGDRTWPESLRRDLQMVFQDPVSALDPRMPAWQIVAEPLAIHEPAVGASDRRTRSLEMLARVGLPADLADRYPHQFSGGQCQRIAIARALVVRPRLLICDEAVSALDVSVQAQIVNLLAGLQDEMGLAILFISHDLAVVQHLSQRVAVMYLGQIIESGSREQVYGRPAHPYTRALLAAVPDPGRRTLPDALAGEVPSPAAPPSGCRFRTRCAHALAVCAQSVPPAVSLRGHRAACHRRDELAARED
jgi:oligopeptide transport system ATP-binding protein